MSIGLIGKKLGMTHVYDGLGRRVAVTAIQSGPCTILNVREPAKHSYTAVQVGFEPVEEKKLTKPMIGQFKKVGSERFRYVREFRVDDLTSVVTGPPGMATHETMNDTKASSEKTALAGDASEMSSPPAQAHEGHDADSTPEPDRGTALAVGQQLTVSIFQQHELVDVTGTSIGKGFQGGVKRHGWSGGPASHGSMSHRAPGSIGAATFPGRVVRGHRLPGHMGHRRVTVQNLRIMQLNLEQHLLLVEGAVPGPEGSLVIVKKSVKRPGVIKGTGQVDIDHETIEDQQKAKGKAKKK